MKQIFILLWISLVLPEFIYAGTMYIKEIKISVRSDQELSGSNVVAFVQTGQEVEELKTDGSWSYIRLPSGKEGWVRNQYLTPERPKYVSIETVQKDCEKLVMQTDTLNEDNKILKEENQRLKSLVAESEKKIIELQKSYETLKTESKDFLKLQSEYKTALMQRDEERLKAEKIKKELENVENKEKYKWFLMGAGVLFVGFILGNITKKQKRKSLY